MRYLLHYWGDDKKFDAWKWFRTSIEANEYARTSCMNYQLFELIHESPLPNG